MEEGCQGCWWVDCCSECRTDFEFVKSGVREEDGKFWMKVVSWQDFGSGETPFESVWSNHRGDSWDVARCMPVEVGSINRGFEDRES